MPVAEVNRMPKVTLYVKDADAPLWERARQLAGDSLSSIVSRALAAYVEEQERRAAAQSALERGAATVTLEVEPDEGPSRKVRFTGVLAYEGEESIHQDAYVTTSGKVVIAHFIDDGQIGSLTVFDSYKQFLSTNPSTVVGAAVAETIGEEWIEEID